MAIRHVETGAGNYQYAFLVHQIQCERVIVEVARRRTHHRRERIQCTGRCHQRQMLAGRTASITARRVSYKRPPGAHSAEMVSGPFTAASMAYWPGTLAHRRSAPSRSIALRKSLMRAWSPDSSAQPTRQPQARCTLLRPLKVIQGVHRPAVRPARRPRRRTAPGRRSHRPAAADCAWWRLQRCAPAARANNWRRWGYSD